MVTVFVNPFFKLTFLLFPSIISFMSILSVEHLTHGFGDRAIFQDVSFRLLKGEHIGLIGANGE